MSYFKITVGNSTAVDSNAQCIEYRGPPVPSAGNINITCTGYGRYVGYIRLGGGTDTGVANLCEVVVEGYETVGCRSFNCQGSCDDLNGCSKCANGTKYPDCITARLAFGSSDLVDTTPVRISSDSVTWTWTEGQPLQISSEVAPYIGYYIYYRQTVDTRWRKTRIPYIDNTEGRQEGTVTGLQAATRYQFDITGYRRYVDGTIHESQYRAVSGSLGNRFMYATTEQDSIPPGPSPPPSLPPSSPFVTTTSSPKNLDTTTDIRTSKIMHSSNSDICQTYSAMCPCTSTTCQGISSGSTSLSGGAIAGIAIAITVINLLLIAVAFLFFRRGCSCTSKPSENGKKSVEGERDPPVSTTHFDATNPEDGRAGESGYETVHSQTSPYQNITKDGQQMYAHLTTPGGEYEEL